MQPNKGELARSLSTNQNYRIMIHDFELLKSSPSVIANGITTKVDGTCILKLYDNYMDDVYDYLKSKGIEVRDEGEAWDYDPRFNFFISDGWGTEYVALNLDLMTENEVDWDYDYVFVDTKPFPTFKQTTHDRIWSLDSIDIANDIEDLTEEDCKKLRSEVCIGSCYLADYNNSFFLDRKELSDYCDAYDIYIEEEGLEDTPENFAYYLMNVA